MFCVCILHHMNSVSITSLSKLHQGPGSTLKGYSAGSVFRFSICWVALILPILLFLTCLLPITSNIFHWNVTGIRLSSILLYYELDERSSDLRFSSIVVRLGRSYAENLTRKNTNNAVCRMKWSNKWSERRRCEYDNVQDRSRATRPLDFSSTISSKSWDFSQEETYGNVPRYSWWPVHVHVLMHREHMRQHQSALRPNTINPPKTRKILWLRASLSLLARNRAPGMRRVLNGLVTLWENRKGGIQEKIHPIQFNRTHL